jgi:Uri superfamily endonuclease
MKTKEDIVVEILLANEHRLSDGYYYYTGYTEESVEICLREIAKEVLLALEAL